MHSKQAMQLQALGETDQAVAERSEGNSPAPSADETNGPVGSGTVARIISGPKGVNFATGRSAN